MNKNRELMPEMVHFVDSIISTRRHRPLVSHPATDEAPVEP